MGMFGGLAALPLYLQIVKGATATQAGLMLLPMTLGIMAGSIVSGQLISRTGRYRHFPIIGSVLLVLSLFGFHYVGADTDLWKVMIGMFFFGIGLGFNFQPLTLAVQNAVDRKDMGVATSSATFTRQIGGTLGTAVFLSILFSQAGTKINEAFRRRRPTRPSSPQHATRRAATRRSTRSSSSRSRLDAVGPASGAGEPALQDSSFIEQLDPTPGTPLPRRLRRGDVRRSSSSPRACWSSRSSPPLFLPHVDLGPDPRKAAEADDEPPAMPAGH